MTIRPTAARNSFWFIWRIPVALAILTVFGLLAALLATGIWHGLAWLALATPVLVGIWFSLRSCRK